MYVEKKPKEIPDLKKYYKVNDVLDEECTEEINRRDS